MNENWTRWIFASTSKHFSLNTGDLEIFYEGQKRSAEFEETDLIESVIKEITNMISGRIISIIDNHGISARIVPPKIQKRNKIWMLNKKAKFTTFHYKSKIGDIQLNCSLNKK